MSSVLSKRQQARNERALQELIKTVPGNDRCADCQTRNPGWASWSLGIFLCMRCAALHRKLGTHISKVKSLSMDSWSKEQVENMKRNGNISSNRQFNPQNIRPPIPLDVDEIDSAMERFIRQKYETRTLQAGGNTRPTGRQHTGSTSSDDQPPPLPPKSAPQRFATNIRSASSTFPSPSSPAFDRSQDNGRGISPNRENKPSRVFGASIPTSNTEAPTNTTGESFESKLANLRDMGFLDDRRNITVLKAVNGNLEQTVEALIRLGEGSGTAKSVTSVPPTTNNASLASPGSWKAAESVNSYNPFDLRITTSGETTNPAINSAPPQMQMYQQQQQQQQQQQLQLQLHGPVGGGYVTGSPQTMMNPQNPFMNHVNQQDAQQRQLQQSFQNLQVSQALFPNATGGYPQQQQQGQQMQYQQPLTPPIPQYSRQNNYFAQPQPELRQQQSGGNSNPFLMQPTQTFVPSQTNPYANSPISPVGSTFQYMQQQQQPQQQQYSNQNQQPFVYQQQQPQIQQATPQQTARAPNSSIMALYNYPELAPTPPPVGTNTVPSAVSPTDPSAPPAPKQPPWASATQGQRSVSTPVIPASGSRNPFLGGGSPFGGSGGGGGASTGGETQRNGLSRHVSQESVDVGAWQSGRHSPDAFASLSARFVR